MIDAAQDLQPPVIVVNAAPPVRAVRVVHVVHNWNFTVPAERFKLYTLLTIMGVAVTAFWTGEFAEHYVGWAAPADNASCGQMH